MECTNKNIITLSLFLFYCICLSAADKQHLYVFYDSSDGLSQDEVTSITQDHDGLMWFATRGGLNSFDGHKFRTLRPVFDEGNTMASSSIERIFTDSKGRIWIGYKKGGVSIYHPESKWFEHIYVESFQEDGRVISFGEDEEGRIYIGQWESGLVIYDYENDIQTHLLSNSKITAIAKGEGNTMWVTTNIGLFKLNSKNFSLERIGEISEDLTCIEIDTIRECLWMGSWGKNLIKYNYKLNKVFRYNLADKYPLNVYSLLLTRSGSLLIGSWGRGLYSYNPELTTFTPINISDHAQNNSPYSHNGILDLFQDKQNNIWIGANGDGVIMQKERQNIIQYQIFDKNQMYKPVSDLVQDYYGTYFLACENHGIAYSSDLENFKWFVTDSKYNSRISCLYPFSKNRILFSSTDKNLQFTERKDGNYIINNFKYPDGNGQYLRKICAAAPSKSSNYHWLGTQQRGLALVDIDTITNSIKLINRFHAKHQNKKYRISDNRVSSLISDSVLWIGTYGGLDYYNYITDEVIHFTNDIIVGKLSDRIILSFSIDENGIIWCGTPSGLNKIYLDNNLWKVQYYGLQEGLPNAYITGVVHDINKMLWVSTNQGLAVYDPELDRFNAYVKGQMSGRLRFLDNSLAINNNGEVVFGGINGIAICKDNFSASSLKNDNTLYISSIKLSGKELQGRIKIDGKKYEIGHPNDLETLRISHNTKQLEFNVSSLDFVNLGSIRYEYMLSSNMPQSPQKWQVMATDGTLRFDNLNSGHYSIKIRAINIFDNSTGKERMLKLIIPPPAYRSWWAYCIYITLFIGLIALIFYMNKLKHKAHLAILKRNQQEELNEIQTQAFVNISHEFKTPLTIISAFIKELLSKKDLYKFNASVLSKLNSIAMSSKRMNDMIIDLATFRKSQQKGISIHESYLHLPTFIKEVTQPFAEIIAIRGGRFKVKHDKGCQHLMIDGEKLQILINNLLSNAIKFSIEVPEIKLYINAYDNILTIRVDDNGIGIEPEQRDRIFDRFYRVSNNVSGSGIGLSLVKQIVDAQKGSIEVLSKNGQGTTFIVKLPFREADIKHIEEFNNHQHTEMHSETRIVVSNTSKVIDSANKPQILIVEDKPQMRQLMESILIEDYTVIKASDGLEGYKQAKLTNPKLIVSDITMPYGDGVQLLMKIRENKVLGSTPVLIVTGNDDQETILKCFDNGADDVIKKPFDPILFKTKVQSLMQMRSRLKNAYSQKIHLSSSKEEVTPKQAVFITKLLSTIEENIKNPQLGLPFLAEKFALSSSGLYRKVKNACGKTVVELIRTVKIDAACTLLRDTQRNIEDICFEVGFSDLRYFQKCFKEEKGMTPNEYRKKYI